MFRQMLLRSLLTIACAVSLPVTAAWAAGSVQVSVDKLNVRSGPSLQDSVITTLPIQSVLPVLSTKNDWIQVKLPNGQTGWVANYLVKQVQGVAAAPVSQIESTTSDLNVRSGPGQTYSVVQTIDPGTRYPIVQKSGQWIQIQLSGQTKGWVAGWLVKESPAASSTANAPAAAKSPAVQGASLTLDFAPYVYASPDASTPAIGQLHAGQNITVLTKQNGWIQFPYEGVHAWIPAKEAPVPSLPGAAHDSDNPPSPVTPPAAAAKQTAKPNTDGLNLRSEANTTSAILGTLPLGSTLTVLEKQGEWYRVQTAAGKTGWVAGWLVTVSDAASSQPQAPTPSGPYVTIINPDTNVRSGPGTEHEVVSLAQTGQKYAIISKSGDWFQVALGNGATGYIAGWLVSANGTSAVTRSNVLLGKVIVIDPGHGGNDTGATGSSFSTLEKTVNLQVALLLRNKLEAAGAKVIMTRADDRKLTLQQRVDVAVNNHADIFVSIHHNTHPNTATNGSIVFYYNQGNSSKLASLVQNELVKATSYKDLQSRFGDYFVLRENPVTAILAEIGFLSNYNEEIRVRSEKQQDLAAEGLYKGIVQYFSAQSTQGS